MRHWWLLSSIGLGLGCSVDAPDYAAKGCPCIAGWRCDDQTRTCVQEASGASALISIRDFRGTWSTPNQIRWTWEPEGNAADFSNYELIVGTSEAAVLAREDAHRFTSNENPELGRYLLPRTGDEEPLRATVSDQLEPDTLYFAQLVVTDTRLNRSTSSVAALRTGLSPQSSLEWYEDSPNPGYFQPACIQETENFPHGNTKQNLEYVVQCAGEEAMCSSSGASQCWLQFKLADQSFDLSGVSAGNLQAAYLEFALAIDSEVDVYWGAVDVSVAGHAFGLEPYSFRADGAYRLYQVPLTALTDQGNPLDTDTLAAPVDQFFVGGSLPDGARVFLDSIYVRW